MMLRSALGALNRTYSGSLRREENITRFDPPQNAYLVEQEGAGFSQISDLHRPKQ